MDTWDYIVVGGGTAGCVLAARLSEQADHKVLLLEAGGSARSPFIRIPNGIYFLKGNPRYHWLYETEADPTRVGRRETLTCGKVLGGGSSVNGMVHVDLQMQDIAAWEAAAGPLWSSEILAECAERARKTLGVSSPKALHPSAHLFLESALKSGFSQEGGTFPHPPRSAMPCPSSARDGWRRSAAEAYLAPAAARPNLTVITRAQAEKILIRNGDAFGVIGSVGGQSRRYYARSEVIVSCGALNTPCLLMHSGVGPPKVLGAAGVPVRVASPELGKNLQDHPCLWIAARVSISTWNKELAWLRVARAGLDWLLRRQGIAASPMCHATLFGSTSSTANYPDFQMSFMPAGYRVMDHGVEFIKASSVTTAVSLCRPSGRGSVQIENDDPQNPPRIDYRLLNSEADVRVLAAACGIARDIYQRPPFANILQRELVPGETVNSEEEWMNFARRESVNMCHPAGTCRMGADTLSVVDPSLNVRGIQNLRVVDASIMPTISSGNTNAPVLTIAERAADLILNTAEQA